MSSEVKIQFLSINYFLSFQRVFKDLLSTLLLSIFPRIAYYHGQPSVPLNQCLSDLELSTFDQIHRISLLSLSIQILPLDSTNLSELWCQLAQRSLC